MKEIVFIGEHFYEESGTLMSPLYERLKNGRWKRYDYGFLRLDLESGKDVKIRQATRSELRSFEDKLNEMLVKWGRQTDSMFNTYYDMDNINEHIAGLSDDFDLLG